MRANYKYKPLTVLFILILGILSPNPRCNAQDIPPNERPNAQPFETFDMIKLSPQVIKVYPLDVFDLEIIAKYSPAYWGQFNGFALQSDYSVNVPSTLPDAVRGGLQLRSGNGSAEWTLDSLSLPGATDSLVFTMGVNATGSGSGDVLAVTFNSTSYDLANAGSISTNTPFVCASGTKVKLEVFGSTIRLYLDGVLKYTQTYSSTNPYPVRYIVAVAAALTSGPATNHIPPPVLVGDWQTTEEYVGFYIPSTLGTYTLNTQRYVATVTAGSVPGSYTVRGAIGVIGQLDETGADTGTEELLTTGEYLAVNDTVIFGKTPSGTLPGGISEDITYYVVAWNAGTLKFKVSLTQGGSAVNITAAGTDCWVAKTTSLALQGATGQVIIPPFDVLGIPATGNITMKPGETRRFATTYDNAQNYTTLNYITRSATTGSFDASGLYTAPTAAGTSTLTFASNGQSRVFTVTVEPYIRMTDSNGRVFEGDGDIAPIAPGEIVTFSTNLNASAGWAVVGGTEGANSSGGGVSSMIYTAPSVLKQRCRITADHGGTSLYMEAVVLDELPVGFSQGYQGEGGGTVLARTAEDGVSVWSVSQTPVGVQQENSEFSINGMTVAEWDDFLDFFEGTATVAGYYRTQEPFFITDELRDERQIVRFDSPYRYQVSGCLVDVSFRLAKFDVSQI